MATNTIKDLAAGTVGGIAQVSYVFRCYLDAKFLANTGARRTAI